MNYKLKTIFLAGTFSLAFVGYVAGQSFDAERMNRDIRIMESVLNEMLSDNLHEGNHRGTFNWFGDNSSIKGVHLHDFGVLFQITAVNPSAVFGFPIAFGSMTEWDSSVTFVSKKEWVSNVTEDYSKKKDEIVKAKIIDFLKNYAPTIGQLDDDDQVVVVYDQSRDERIHMPRLMTRNKKVHIDSDGKKKSVRKKGTDKKKMVKGSKPGKKRKRIKHSGSNSSFSVSVKASTLDRYQKDQIDDAQFVKEVTFHEKENKRPVDLTILENIFETAFKNVEDETLLLTGKPSSLFVDGFGAIVNFDAMYPVPYHKITTVLFGSEDEDNMHFEILEDDDQIHTIKDKKEIIIKEEKGDDDDDKKKSDRRKKMIDKKKELAAEVKENKQKAYENFKTLLSEYLVDYGRTLTSVASNETVLVSVSINDRSDVLPNRVDFKISKKALEDYDQNNKSQQRTIDEIVIKEY